MSDIIHVKRLHTGEMMRHELLLCYSSKFHLTARRLMALAYNKSPLLYKVSWTDENLDLLRTVCCLNSADILQDVKDAQKELDAAFRALAIIQPSQYTPSRISKIDVFSPEWFVDLLSSASRAIPGTSYNDLLDMSFCLLCHLVASNARHNGLTTERPDDLGNAIRQLSALNKI